MKKQVIVKPKFKKIYLYYLIPLFLITHSISASTPFYGVEKYTLNKTRNNNQTLMNKELEIPNADPSGRFIPTLNKMGYMTTYLDPFSKEFVKYAAESKKPVLEVGAAYGIATLAALSHGATVFCNDIDIRHLKIVEQLAKEKDRPRLKLVPGSFPKELNYPDNTFKAILVARVLHFFDPKTLELSLQKAYSWLKPGGKLFIVADTPYLKNMAAFIPKYEERVRAGEKWPGMMNPKEYVNDPNFHDFVHVLDVKILSRILLKAGFKIEKIGYLSRTDYPTDRQLDGRESIAAIAVKPE